MADTGMGSPKVIGAIFFIVGLGLLAGAGWAGNRQYTILKTWPSVEAQVVNSEVMQYRDSEGDTMYKAAIDFRYTVEGMEYTVPSSSSYSSSSRSGMQKKVDAYAPGTRHPVRYNPADPSDMRFDVGYNFGFFFLPLLFGGMGIIFAGIGGGLLYTLRSTPSLQCPSCGQPAEKGQKFCANCAAALPID